MGEEWPPREVRARAALLRGKAHLAKGEWFQAHRAFLAAADAADGAERELARGLVHVAVAGYRTLAGNEASAARQREHAQARLAPFGARLDELGLLEQVKRVLALPGST